MIGAVVVGNVGQDAEVRDAGGTKVLSFSVASNNKQKVAGEWVDHTDWINVSLFGDRGEKLAQYIKKGGQVAARGNLFTRSYEKDGVKRTSLELRADDIQLLGGKPDGAKSTKPETGFDVF